MAGFALIVGWQVDRAFSTCGPPIMAIDALSHNEIMVEPDWLPIRHRVAGCTRIRSGWVNGCFANSDVVVMAGSTFLWSSAKLSTDMARITGNNRMRAAKTKIGSVVIKALEAVALCKSRI